MTATTRSRNTTSNVPDNSSTAVTSSTSSPTSSPRGHHHHHDGPPGVDSDTSTSTSARPKIGTRKNSGTIIVPRDAPNVELKQGEEVFDEDDARAMSPRRTSKDLEKMSQEARAQLSQHAKLLHESLLEIFNRIEAVKEEHDKLDSNNKFLQKYIGDLMSTSKITATGSGNRKK